MNYRHAYHAGNFADVVKHLALVTALLHLRKKETPFFVMDSHAGRGRYDLAAGEAQKTGEAQNGIARLDGVHGAEALEKYLELARGADHYPGSPLIAAMLLRPQDRLVACEKHPEDSAALKIALAPFARARVEAGDGYAALARLLPPPERRGLVLLDPPFEAPDECEIAARAARDAYRRFATGIYLLWYPVKSAAQARAFCGEVLTCGAARALAVEASITAPEGKLARAGLLVLNPPFGFAAQMRQGLDLIGPRLTGFHASLYWLAGAPD